MNTKSTELNKNFDYPIDADFHNRFFKGLTICFLIAIAASVGLITCVLYAKEIDAFCSDVLKAIFI